MSEFKPRKSWLGLRFGRITILSFSHADEQGKGYYNCLCDCGSTKIIDSHHLKLGTTKSCGCLKVEVIKKLETSKKTSGLTKLWNEYKRNSRTRKLEFSLTKLDFESLTSSDCSYCGAPSSVTTIRHSPNGAYTHNGIDRVDNLKGYTPENCVSCCRMCNWFKSNYSYEDFISQVKRIHSYLGL